MNKTQLIKLMSLLEKYSNETNGTVFDETDNTYNLVRKTIQTKFNLSVEEVFAEMQAQEENTREQLAEYAHEAWSGWMRYMFSRGERMQTLNDGEYSGWWMTETSFERWQRQMNTEFKALPENEKASDRAEADKMLAIVGK